MDNYSYDQTKRMINQNNDNQTTYNAKKIMNLDEEYQRTGIYNGQDMRSAAKRDYDEMMTRRGYEKDDEGNYNLVSFEGAVKVGKKPISKESKTKKIKKSIAIVSVALGLANGVIFGADIINHPENYLSTYPNFQGHVTYSEMIKRTPENFGIGR